MTDPRHAAQAAVLASHIAKLPANRPSVDPGATSLPLLPPPPSFYVDGVPPEYREATLVPGLRAVLKAKPSAAYLHGAPGTGKTHQAWAMVLHWRRRIYATAYPPKDQWESEAEARARMERDRDTDPQRVLIITESAHLRRHRHDREWLDGVAKHAGWLVVDDIGFTTPDTWVIESVYHLANERRAWKRPTLWTSNLTPAELATTFSPAIASRLSGDQIVTMGGRDRRVAP